MINFFSLALFPRQLHLSSQDRSFCFHWMTHKMHFPHGATRCPGLTKMTQGLELLSAWVCADILEGVAFRARFLELFERGCSGLSPFGSPEDKEWISLGQSWGVVDCFCLEVSSPIKNFPLFLRRKEWYKLTHFVRLRKRGIPESLPLWIDY